MGLKLTCPANELLGNNKFDDASIWTITGPGWTIANGQLTYTADNTGDQIFQPWTYINAGWQYHQVKVDTVEIAGWFFFTQEITGPGIYTEIFQTNEPAFPVDYIWTGGLGNPGDKMVFDWFSVIHLPERLACSMGLMTYPESKYEYTGPVNGDETLRMCNVNGHTRINVRYETEAIT